MPTVNDEIVDAQGITLSNACLIAGDMTYVGSPMVRRAIHRFDWTNAMVVALGGVGNGNIKVCTLPAKTVVTNAFVVINSPDTSSNNLTVAVGRVSTTYIDYVTANNAKAAAGTVYGGVTAHRGTNNLGADCPSVSAATDVFAHFIKTTTNLSTVTGSTGSVYLETVILP